MKAVLVTGASGGIGQALVRAFSAARYAVIGTDVEDRADHGCDVFVRCDLSELAEDEACAERAFAAVREALTGRPLAALVNNAAVQILDPVGELSREAWRKTFNVNVIAPFLLSREFLPELEKGRGMVLNVSSIHARQTKPRFVAYATSKAALSGMTRAMAVELGQRVRVNAIEPAAIDTPMLRAGFEGNEPAYELLKAYHPTGAIGSTEELARLAVSIVRDGGDFLNGAVLAVDGGISACLHDPA